MPFAILKKMVKAAKKPRQKKAPAKTKRAKVKTKVKIQRRKSAKPIVQTQSDDPEVKAAQLDDKSLFIGALVDNKGVVRHDFVVSGPGLLSTIECVRHRAVSSSDWWTMLVKQEYSRLSPDALLDMPIEEIWRDIQATKADAKGKRAFRILQISGLKMVKPGSK